MKRRRDLGPKKIKNRRVLIKFIIWAVVAAVVGAGLAYLAYYLLGLLPAVDPEKGTSVIRQLPGMLVIVTILTVIGILFFGVRGYLSGSKVRHSLQSSRVKFKHPRT